MYTSDNEHQQSRVCRIGAQVVHLLLRCSGRVWALYVYPSIWSSNNTHATYEATGEIHEMKPNKTGRETAIHLEVYSSIHTVYLPTHGHRASDARYNDTARYSDTSIQRDTMYRMYHQCITTPQAPCPNPGRVCATIEFFVKSKNCLAITLYRCVSTGDV